MPGGGGTCFPWKESFDAKKFDMAFTRFGKYQAAGNFFWINHRFTVHKGVPTNRGAVKSLMQTLAKSSSSLRHSSFRYLLMECLILAICGE